jgi:hypothetical protein
LADSEFLIGIEIAATGTREQIPKEIFFVSRDRRLMNVTLAIGDGAIEVEKASRLFGRSTNSGA